LMEIKMSILRWIKDRVFEMKVENLSFKIFGSLFPVPFIF
jgi:hypothetical protein